jgi:hypothetical protein
MCREQVQLRHRLRDSPEWRGNTIAKIFASSAASAPVGRHGFHRQRIDPCARRDVHVAIRGIGSNSNEHVPPVTCRAR